MPATLSAQHLTVFGVATDGSREVENGGGKSQTLVWGGGSREATNRESFGAERVCCRADDDTGAYCDVLYVTSMTTNFAKSGVLEHDEQPM